MLMLNNTEPRLISLCHGTIIAANVSTNFLSVNCDSFDGNNSNNSCVSSALSINYRTTGLSIVALLLSSVILCTALGNLLVGLALIRFRALRSVSNLLIGNLALSDFLLAVIVLPLSTVNECLGHWVFGPFTCNLWLIVDVLCCTASIWNLCMIAVDRFTATFYPLWYRGEGRQHGGRYATICSIIVWMIAAAASLPPLLGWKDLESNFVKNVVTFQTPSSSEDSVDYGWTGECGTVMVVNRCVLFRKPSYVMYSASVSFYVPCLVTLALYANILAALRRRRTKSSSSISSGSGRRRKSSEIAFDGQRCRTIIDNSASPSCADDNAAVPAGPPTAGDSVDRLPIRQESVICWNWSTSGSGRRQRHLYPDVSDSQSLTHVSLRKADGDGDAIDGDGDAIDGDGDAVSLQPGERLTKIDQKRWKRVIKLAHVNLRAKNSLNGAMLDGAEDGDRMTSSVRTKLEVEYDSANGVDDNSTFIELPVRSCKKARRDSVLETFHNLTAGFRGSNREQRRRRASSSEQLETRATIRTAVIVGVLCGTWLGFFTIYVVDGWCQWCRVPRRLYAFFFWLGYVNSALNPILYTVFNNEFRRAFRKILCRRCTRRTSATAERLNAAPAAAAAT